MVVVVGSINTDFVVGVEHHPVPGETVLTPAYETHRGGKGGNQAVAAARAGGDVRFAGSVGADSFGDDLRQSLIENGVDASSLMSVPAPTGAAFISVDKNGQNSIIVAAGANHALTPERLTPAMFDGAGVVLIQLEIPIETAITAARLGREAGARVVLNYSPAVSPNDFVFSDIEYLLVNESEAAGLLGWDLEQVLEAPDSSAGEMLQFAPNVILTLGTRGVVWASSDGTRGSQPALSVDVRDTTGAGDAFAGAFAARLEQDVTLDEAVRFASVAGGLAVTKAGAQPSLPYRNAIAHLLGEQPDHDS